MAISIGSNFVRSGGSFLMVDNDIRGGFQTVTSIAARDAIPFAARKSGMIVRVNTAEGYQDYELGYGKPITNSGWVEATLGGTKGNFIPVEGGDLTGPLAVSEMGSIAFKGAMTAQVFDDNLQWTRTAVIGDDDPEPRGMMSWNDGTANTVELNTSIGQIVCKTEVAISSDRSLKDKIVRIENPLKILNRLYGYTFEKIGSRRRYTGLLAQEVAQVMPEAVERTSDGKLAVFYSTLAGLFVEGINALVELFKGQQEEIDALKKAVNELEGRLEKREAP